MGGSARPRRRAVELAGTKFKIIQGFPGGGATRSEVEGNTKAWAAMKVDNAQWLKEKKVNLLLQYALERSPDLPDVPLMADSARPRRQGRAQAVCHGQRHGPLDFCAARRAGGAHRGAARPSTTLRDPELVGFATERHIDIGPPLGGEGLAKLVAETLSVTPGNGGDGEEGAVALQAPFQKGRGSKLGGTACAPLLSPYSPRRFQQLPSCPAFGHHTQGQERRGWPGTKGRSRPSLTGYARP